MKQLWSLRHDSVWFGLTIGLVAIVQRANLGAVTSVVVSVGTGLASLLFYLFIIGRCSDVPQGRLFGSSEPTIVKPYIRVAQAVFAWGRSRRNR